MKMFTGVDVFWTVLGPLIYIRNEEIFLQYFLENFEEIFPLYVYIQSHTGMLPVA